MIYFFTCIILDNFEILTYLKLSTIFKLRTNQNFTRNIFFLRYEIMVLLTVGEIFDLLKYNKLIDGLEMG
jgi:hypothetical protein